MTTEPSNEAHTHFESSSAPVFPKNSYFPQFNVTNTYDSPVWKHIQNFRKEFEEFEWHLRCATLLFFNWLAAIFRLWQFAAWYIFVRTSPFFRRLSHLQNGRPGLPKLSLLGFYFRSFPLSGLRWCRSLGAILPTTVFPSC